MAEKILEVRNLKISFRTNNGTVKAVRNISFDLNRGETLSIVGESGSGKSVTSKAILGILAGNSIIDGGEILYDGRDLLKISEEEMHKLRGDKIAMIFQDPLSSLDPIVKIGRQITEAMLLKNKAARRMSRKSFNGMLKRLEAAMVSAKGENPEEAAKIAEMIKTFDSFNIEALKMQNSFNTSMESVDGVLSKLNDVLFRISKKQPVNLREFYKTTRARLSHVTDAFILHTYGDRLGRQNESFLKKILETPKGDIMVQEAEVLQLEALQTLLEEIKTTVTPNFFRIGYYKLMNPEEDLTSKDIAELNETCLTYLNENFMIEFIEYAKAAIAYQQNIVDAKKKEIMPSFADAKKYFESGELIKGEALAKAKQLGLLVKETINPLDVKKDSLAYTFGMSIKSAINTYFSASKFEVKDNKRFERQTAKHDKLVSAGKKVDWKVVPKKPYDEAALRQDIINVISRIEEKYAQNLAENTFDAEVKAIELIDWFKEEASRVVTKLTKTMAKEKAIELMEEVGIPDPRIRFYQYPFEFSGGMRQRIVIAIALAANPDILICDEPTTALDVTIQAQILDLINKLKRERNLSIIFITHDLGVVANMADRIAVMYAGKIVETGTANEVFYSPAHPYTWALLSSMPDLDTKEKLDSIPGTPPNMIYPPVGDAFAARNKYALQIDFEMEPPLFKISDTHYAATWLLHPNAPKVEMPKVIQDRIARMRAKGGEDNAE